MRPILLSIVLVGGAIVIMAALISGPQAPPPSPVPGAIDTATEACARQLGMGPETVMTPRQIERLVACLQPTLHRHGLVP